MTKAESATNNAPRSKVQHEIAFKLTKDDLAAMMERTVEINSEVSVLEAELKASKSELSDKITAKKAEAEKLVVIARAKEERRVVDCEEERDYAANEVRYYVEGKVVESRTMTSDECQRTLDLHEKDNTTPLERKRRQMDSKKAAAGDLEADEPAEDLKAVIRDETGRHTKHASTDGPRHAE